ncbi:unnamed protein product [Medioppia subpectinata]|uniref:Uncharacterized protein n=1 Tax=Medioppia subpectinata TaxID=1979941 RepID=A0A7R9Q0K7_9ACAR|nr:unnamed protein product [Medioppia subpectinata]CAG2108224.1 unnamed protein product [Medioppia subpectinata]
MSPQPQHTSLIQVEELHQVPNLSTPQYTSPQAKLSSQIQIYPMILVSATFVKRPLGQHTSKHKTPSSAHLKTQVFPVILVSTTFVEPPKTKCNLLEQIDADFNWDRFITYFVPDSTRIMVNIPRHKKPKISEIPYSSDIVNI